MYQLTKPVKMIIAKHHKFEGHLACDVLYCHAKQENQNLHHACATVDYKPPAYLSIG